ncbi:hypothetical protein [Streptomyces bauhiniae]|uniref:Uncharacterized protein n=1 Tax=Streptomyces bauhiniae TaxID=2340725 RepID=A0A7K3QL96_9ACTN|nr:hypothetical protein [Streptomyces bauhiniae]NEB90654.1 hypothetical protein [Streptomyces bauhiniae]
MTKHISTSISALGVLVSVSLLAMAVRSASPLWLPSGIFLVAAYALVRDLRRTTRPSTHPHDPKATQ